MADVRGAAGVPIAAAFEGAQSPTPSTPIYINLSNGDAYVLLGSTVTKIATAGVLSGTNGYVLTGQGAGIAAIFAAPAAGVWG
jgi:hypothetical protein